MGQKKAKGDYCCPGTFHHPQNAYAHKNWPVDHTFSYCNGATEAQWHTGMSSASYTQTAGSNPGKGDNINCE